MSREIAVPDTAPSASDLIGALRERAPRAAVALAGAQMAWPLFKRVRAGLAERSRYTIRVPGEDSAYDDLHEWILSLLPEEQRRALVAYSAIRSPYEIMESSESREPASLHLRFDSSREQVITVSGHKVRVSVTDTTEGMTKRREHSMPAIVFTMRSATARDALCGEIGTVLLAAQQASRRPSFRMLNRWEDWQRADGLPPRPLGSVVLPPGQMERIVADAGRFLAAEEEYVRRGVPWHRGHLYEGPPGTGKTSVARAVASHFGLDVWCLPLGAVKKDDTLLRVVGNVRSRSMLLLEDIDVFHAARSRDGKHGLSMSGLLNALDGIATPHGLLTVMTTNTPQVLDGAVVRPGRVDLVEHFGPAHPAETARVIAHFFGVPAPDCTGLADMLPARVVEECKRHDSAAAALAALRASGAETITVPALRRVHD